MNVQRMLYLYLVSCLAMIFFNVAYMLTNRFDGIFRLSILSFRARILACWNQQITDKDRKFFRDRMHSSTFIISFDEIMIKLLEEDPEKSAAFLKSFGSIIAELLCKCGKRSVLRAGSYAYYIRKYPQLKISRFPEVSEKLIQMLGSDDIYCRENALQALYALGNAHNVVRALRVLNRNPEQHNSMVLSIGLRKFTGSHEKLAAELWDTLDEFKPNLQISVIKYIRATSESFCPQMLELMTKGSVDAEVSICAIRYLGEHPYDPAYSMLLELAAGSGNASWEQSAEACIALSAYPGNTTIAVLKSALSSWNWAIRSNAAESLAKLGLQYLDALDVLEGPNRYAAEALRYQLEHKNLTKEAVHT